MKPVDQSRKEDHRRVLKALEANTKSRIKALTHQWEVVRVTPTAQGLVQEIVDTVNTEEEAERYSRIRKAFPPFNCDYYIKPWGTSFKKD